MAINRKNAIPVKCLMTAIMLLLVTVKSFAQAPSNLPVYSSTTPVNYVRTWTATAPITSSAGLVNGNLLQTKEVTLYVDGLGRPLQTVLKKGSLITTDASNASGSDTAGVVDLVTPVLYDAFGREAYKFLPFAANTTGGNSSVSDGLFKTNPHAQQSGFMTNYYTGQGNDGQYAYSQTIFESSPGNRPLEQFAPGESWAGSATQSSEASRRSTKLKYWVNTSVDDVKIWNVTDGVLGLPITSSYAVAGSYNQGELHKTVTIDEQGNQVIEFKDKRDQVILKKVQLTAADGGSGSGYSGWICTYYIYDNLGNLRCVIQPEGVQALSLNGWNLTTTILSEQCFRYEYDGRNRMVVRKLPGSAEVLMVYDVRNRLVMTQDGNLRNASGGGIWSYTLYDQLNRAIQTGLIQPVANDPGTHWAGAMASTGNINANIQYPNNGMLSAATILTETFYDTYDWVNRPAYSGTISDPTAFKAFDNLHNTYLYAASNSTFPYAQQPAKDDRTRGMITGTRVKVLNDPNNRYIYSLTLYDEKGRTVQVKSINYTAGKDITTTQYSWSGLPLIVVSRQEKADAGTTPVTTITKYTYDALGRATQTTQNTIDHNSSVQSGEKILAQNQYDALGKLKTKKLGINSGTPVETQHYDYNIRGWLLGVNRGYVSGHTSTHNFGFDLAYDRQSNLSGTASYARALYNGNVAGMTWRGKINAAELRRYDYEYDAVNRLLRGDFTDFTTSGNNTAYDIKMGDGLTPSTAYDLNGNILKMWQRGLVNGGMQVIDDLTYNYQNGSNKLAKVTDGASPTTGLGDFNNGSNTDDDYDYDVNGNLLKDQNKEITSISYNILNLPQQIVVSNKGTISYQYDATGTKLSKTVDETGVGQTITQYLGGAVFVNGVLQQVGSWEGRVRLELGSWKYDYFLKDHLANIRMVLSDNGTVLEETHYYPFGLQQKKISIQQTGLPVNSLKYNGKEEQIELGLQWLDYGARFYDNQIGRWSAIDPLAELGRKFTPYNYALNNPVRFIDPDGMWVETATGWRTDIPEEIAQALDDIKNGVNPAPKSSTRDLPNVIGIRAHQALSLLLEAQNLIAPGRWNVSHVLPSGRKPDVIDHVNNNIWELKPASWGSGYKNRRAKSQLGNYVTEANKDPKLLGTYSSGGLDFEKPVVEGTRMTYAGYNFVFSTPDPASGIIYYETSVARPQPAPAPAPQHYPMKIGYPGAGSGKLISALIEKLTGKKLPVPDLVPTPVPSPVPKNVPVPAY